MPETAKRGRLFRLLFWTAAVALLLAGVALAVRFGRLSLFCVFQRLTGWNCPGCGNTRAVFACLRFDFLSALRFNYLFPLEIGYLLYVYGICAAEYIKNGQFRYASPCVIADVTFLIVLLLWWILRNYLGI